MNILITGSSGYLGRHLVKYIPVEHQVYLCNSKRGNLHNYDEFVRYCGVQKFDIIYHLAAKTKAGDYCLHHKGEQWIDNQLLNTNILKYWVEKQPQAKMICMGTSCMYEPSIQPLREEDCMKGDPDPGLETYAYTKRMLLMGLKAIAEQYGLEYTYFVPSTLYGPDFDPEDSHFIFDLVKKIYRGKHHGDEVVLWGDGYQRRELIYIDDVVRILWDLRHASNEVINLGTGYDNNIREFAMCVSDHMGYDPNKIVYDTSKYVGAKVKMVWVDKLVSLMPSDFKFTDLKTGVGNVVNYYKETVCQEES